MWDKRKAIKSRLRSRWYFRDTLEKHPISQLRYQYRLQPCATQRLQLLPPIQTRWCSPTSLLYLVHTCPCPNMVLSLSVLGPVAMATQCLSRIDSERTGWAERNANPPGARRGRTPALQIKVFLQIPAPGGVRSRPRPAPTRRLRRAAQELAEAVRPAGRPRRGIPLSHFPYLLPHCDSPPFFWSNFRSFETFPRRSVILAILNFKGCIFCLLRLTLRRKTERSRKGPAPILPVDVC